MAGNNIYIYELLKRYFKARHFQQIPTDISQVTMYATFYEACLYLINIITLDGNYVFDKNMYDQYLETTKKQFGGVDSDRTYLLNVLIVKEPEALMDVVNVEPDLSDTFVDIHWIVNSETKKLVIPDKQVKTLLGLEDVIREVVENGMERFDDLRKISRHVFITRTIVFINVLVYAIMVIIGASHRENWLSWIGNIGVYVEELRASGNIMWYILSMFIHTSFAHLAFTTVSIYLLGSKLEKYLTGFQYVMIYVLSGLIGSLVCYGGSLLTDRTIVSIGASGAVFGLIASALILSQAASRPLEGISDLMMWLIFFGGIFYSVVSRDVAAFANIGGFATGLLLSVPIDIRKQRQLGGSDNEER